MPISEFLSRATRLDAGDDLARFRAAFHLTEGQIYLDGNSLGLASHSAEAAVLSAMKDWRTLAIEGWTRATPPWLNYSETISALLAPMVGAAPDEIAVGNSTTVNLHQFLATLYRPDVKRTKILVDALSFPSNLYALRSHFLGHHLDPQTNLVVVPSADGFTMSESDIVERMGEDVQLAVLPSVLFQSGQLLNVQRLAAEARQRGILIGLDCSHSVGVLPHEFDAWDVDFAYWCTYKYLNGGPGAVSGLFLNRRHFGREPGLAGWFGSRKDRQFAFAPDFEPAPDAQALEISTPHILSMAPLLGSLSDIAEAGMARIRQKSLMQTDLLLELFDRLLAPIGFQLVTPRDASRRGGHISVTHLEGARICSEMRRVGIITDFRPPAMIRITPSPLYTSFQEVFDAVRSIHDIVKTRAFESVAAGTRVI